MPIYVYTCETCGEICEELQRVDAAAPDVPSEGCLRKNAAKTPGQPCKLKKQLTTASPKFVGPDWGGWERTGKDGSMMQRTVAGKATDNYGD